MKLRHQYSLKNMYLLMAEEKSLRNAAFLAGLQHRQVVFWLSPVMKRQATGNL